MNCTICYGFGSNLKHTKILPIAEAFDFVKKNRGYLFYDIYFKNRLVYTESGTAGYYYICKDCPYKK